MERLKERFGVKSIDITYLLYLTLFIVYKSTTFAEGKGNVYDCVATYVINFETRTNQG